MSASDEAVRAVCMALRRECNRNEGRPLDEDISDPIEGGEIQFVDAAISAYRAHTLAGAGEVEHKLRELDLRTPSGCDSAYRQAADLIAAQRERITELEEWRPIETAPKDGTEILVWTYRQYIVRWAHNSYVEAIRRPMTGWFTDYSCEHFIRNPTHWKPLPTTPDQRARAALEGES